MSCGFVSRQPRLPVQKAFKCVFQDYKQRKPPLLGRVAQVFCDEALRLEPGRQGPWQGARAHDELDPAECGGGRLPGPRSDSVASPLRTGKLTPLKVAAIPDTACRRTRRGEWTRRSPCLRGA